MYAYATGRVLNAVDPFGLQDVENTAGARCPLARWARSTPLTDHPPNIPFRISTPREEVWLDIEFRIDSAQDVTISDDFADSLFIFTDSIEIDVPDVEFEVTPAELERWGIKPGTYFPHGTPVPYKPFAKSPEERDVVFDLLKRRGKMIGKEYAEPFTEATKKWPADRGAKFLREKGDCAPAGARLKTYRSRMIVIPPKINKVISKGVLKGGVGFEVTQ